jgi:hypothetical protein
MVDTGTLLALSLTLFDHGFQTPQFIVFIGILDKNDTMSLAQVHSLVWLYITLASEAPIDDGRGYI